MQRGEHLDDDAAARIERFADRILGLAECRQLLLRTGNPAFGGLEFGGGVDERLIEPSAVGPQRLDLRLQPVARGLTILQIAFGRLELEALRRPFSLFLGRALRRRHGLRALRGGMGHQRDGAGQSEQELFHVTRDGRGGR